MIGLRRQAGALGCVAVAVTLVALLVCLLLAPNVTVVGAVVFLILRRKLPDRLLAVAVLAVWAVPAWALWSPPMAVLWWRPVLGWWVGWTLPEDGIAWVITGVVWGPFLGAGLWLLGQRRRERSPYAGADELEARQRTEERRRRWTVQT